MSESTLQIKTRLIQLGLKQVDLLEPLWKRGFTGLSSPYLNRIINRRDNGPTAKAVLESIEIILSELEQES